MIKNLNVTGVHTDVDANLEKYVTKKLGRLDKYVSRHVRESLHAEVKLKEEKAKDKCNYTAEVVLHLPHDTLMVKECTLNMYAAVDIVEEKLKQQLLKYKQLHMHPRLSRRITARLRGSSI